MRLFLASLIVAALPQFASAGCPSANASQSGIKLSRSSPLMEITFTKQDDTKLIHEHRVWLKDGVRTTSATTYFNGLMPHELKRPDVEVKIDYADHFETSLQTLPEVGKLSTQAAVYIDGTQRDEGEHRLTFLGKREIKIGTCTLETWLVLSETKWQNLKSNRFAQYYSPRYDFSLGATKLDEAQKPVSTIFFDTITALSE